MALTPVLCSNLVAAGVVIALTVHCLEYGVGMRVLQRLHQDTHPKAQANVQSAAWEVRSQYYVKFCRYLIHFVAISMFWFTLNTVWNPSYIGAWLLAEFLAAWAQHHACLRGWLPVHPRSLKAISVIHYGAFLTFNLGCMEMQLDGATSITLNTFQTIIRGLIAVIFADPSIAVPGQCLLSLTDTWIFYTRYGGDSLVCHVPVQILTLASTCMISGLCENWITSQTEALLESKATVRSFRRMLRGLCDGEVVLDSELRICDGALCLQRLLMVPSNFDKQNFGELLVPEQLSSFQSFLQSALAEEENQDAMPACLRVTLEHPEASPIGVDVFHVKMPHIGESGQHLIALREDGDIRRQRERERTLAMERFLVESSESESSDPPSFVHRVPQALPSSLPLCTELSDMTLLVDASTPQFEINQAHLSFVRQPGEDSTIPTLRNMVRPTDWEQVRERLLSIAESESATWSMSMHLQDGPSKRYKRAKGVQVSSFAPPGQRGADSNFKLRLNFPTLIDAPLRTPSLGSRSMKSLDRIKECGEDSDGK